MAIFLPLGVVPPFCEQSFRTATQCDSGGVGLSSPLFVTSPPGDFNRLFIVQQGGQIRILNLKTGVINASPFLTVGNIVSGGEQGLLGLAFDPDYATNRKFYVKCTAPGGAFKCRQQPNSPVSSLIEPGHRRHNAGKYQNAARN